MSYARVSILGSSANGEVWSINPTYDPTGEFPGWDQARADAAVAAINALTIPADLLACMSDVNRVTGCRIDVRDDATDDLIGTATNLRSSPPLGSGLVKLPQQSAIVTSLRTNTPGASGRGRLYWPALGVTLNEQVRMQTPTPGNFLVSMKGYLTAIGGALQTGFTGITFSLAVRSRTTHQTPHVTNLKLGDVIDTQRRRRDAVAETYLTTTYP